MKYILLLTSILIYSNIFSQEICKIDTIIKIQKCKLNCSDIKRDLEGEFQIKISDTIIEMDMKMLGRNKIQKFKILKFIKCENTDNTQAIEYEIREIKKMKLDENGNEVQNTELEKSNLIFIYTKSKKSITLDFQSSAKNICSFLFEIKY